MTGISPNAPSRPRAQSSENSGSAGSETEQQAEESTSLTGLYVKHGFSVVDQAIKNTFSDQLGKEVQEQISDLDIPQSLKDEANSEVAEVVAEYKGPVEKEIQDEVNDALENSNDMTGYVTSLRYQMQDRMETAKYDAEKQGVVGNWLIKFAVQLGITVGRNEKRAVRDNNNGSFFENTFRDAARDVINNIVDSLVVVAKKR